MVVMAVDDSKSRRAKTQDKDLKDLKDDKDCKDKQRSVLEGPRRPLGPLCPLGLFSRASFGDSRHFEMIENPLQQAFRRNVLRLRR